MSNPLSIEHALLDAIVMLVEIAKARGEFDTLVKGERFQRLFTASQKAREVITNRKGETND